jgi:hypothetical protein
VLRSAVEGAVRTADGTGGGFAAVQEVRGRILGEARARVAALCAVVSVAEVDATGRKDCEDRGSAKVLSAMGGEVGVAPPGNGLDDWVRVVNRMVNGSV